MSKPLNTTLFLVPINKYKCKAHGDCPSCKYDA